MASAAAPTATSVARGNSIHSSLGTVAPLNTPTRRFYGAQDQLQAQEPGVPNPNIYVVQPFKNASVPKDFVYAKRNAPNPGEKLLNSTMELINHFTSCYEAVKHQLQDEHSNKERDSVLVSRSMTIGGTNNTLSRSNVHRPAKQAKLRPLMLQPHQQIPRNNQGPIIEDCVGISPVPVTKADDLAQVYQGKLNLLRKMKPEYFDAQGNLLSRETRRVHSSSQVSHPSSKKSAASTFRTPHNTLLTAENLPFDERRTFLTELTNEEQEGAGHQQKTTTITDLMKNNYVLKVLEIKTITTKSSKRDRTKSASDKDTFFSRNGNMTAKST